MARIRLDDLNVITYDDYFDSMDISEARKKARIELAEKFEDVFVDIFMMIYLDYLENIESRRFVYYDEAKNMIDSVLVSLGIDTENDYKELKNYGENTAELIVDTTLENIKAEIAESDDGKIQRDSYWLSNDRARFISADQSETVFSSKEYIDAVNSGKEFKIWHTILDGKERLTHNESDGQRVRIEDRFLVGSSYMLYPHDIISPDVDPKEIINCRCWLTYE